MTPGTPLPPPSPAQAERIRALFARDRWMARGAVLALWATLGFVYFAIPHGFLSTPVGLVLSVAVALVLLFNTASIGAMLRHYREDRDHIYGLDLLHLDEHRARRAAAAARQGPATAPLRTEVSQ